MSADEHLSPTQFGFVEAPTREWLGALSKHTDEGGRPGRIDPNMTLHTAQRSIHKPTVDLLAAKKFVVGDHEIEIYHHEGRAWAGEGHHRIAAARQRGSKSIRVTHYGRD